MTKDRKIIIVLGLVTAGLLVYLVIGKVGGPSEGEDETKVETEEKEVEENDSNSQELYEMPQEYREDIKLDFIQADYNIGKKNDFIDKDSEDEKAYTFSSKRLKENFVEEMEDTGIQEAKDTYDFLVDDYYGKKEELEETLYTLVNEYYEIALDYKKREINYYNKN